MMTLESGLLFWATLYSISYSQYGLYGL